MAANLDAMREFLMQFSNLFTNCIDEQSSSEGHIVVRTTATTKTKCDSGLVNSLVSLVFRTSLTKFSTQLGRLSARSMSVITRTEIKSLSRTVQELLTTDIRRQAVSNDFM